MFKASVAGQEYLPFQQMGQELGHTRKAAEV